jgi:hypothetical protein
MENTINVTVTYTASDECQKELLVTGLSAIRNQKIIIAMPPDVVAILPVHVDSDGIAELKLVEEHYRIDSDDTYHCDSYKGIACVCCGETNHDSYSVIKPLQTCQNVLDLVNANKARLSKVDAMIITIKTQKEATKKLQQELTAKITTELEAKYSQSNGRLAKIATLIEGKTRVRTAQIRDIIEY